MSRNFFVTRIWLVLVVIAVSLMASPAFAQGGTVVRVEPAALSAQVNDNVNLSIKVDNIANLTAMELHLAFNPAVLEVTQVTNGGFVAADFVAQNVFDNTAGTIDYAVAQMNRAPAQGSGTLLNITFRAKANGSSSLALRGTQAVQTGLLLSDQNGLAIQASWANGNVTVGNQAASATPVTPAPATATPITPAPATATPVTPGAATATPVTPGAATATPVTPGAATATPTAIPATPVPQGGILGTHEVRFGETLYCIGRAYKVTPWAIAKANGIWWPYFIFPYQKLSIPNTLWSPIPGGPICQTQFSTSTPPPTATPSPTATPTTATAVPTTATPATVVPATATPVPPTTACRYYHTVRAGDNLFRIGLRYGVSYTEIARVNHISNNWLIYTGQQLCIP